MARVGEDGAEGCWGVEGVRGGHDVMVRELHCWDFAAFRAEK